MVSKYRKTQGILDSIKRCYFYNMKQEDMLDVIEFDTGKKLTLDELRELIKQIKGEIKTQEIEVDTYMKHMVSFGVLIDQMQNHEMLKSLKNMVYAMITREMNKPNNGNKNFILAASTQLTKIMEAMDKSIISAGYIKKAQGMIEQNKMAELEKTTKIMIEDKTHDTEELIDSSIDKHELKDNRVA